MAAKTTNMRLNEVSVKNIAQIRENLGHTTDSEVVRKALEIYRMLSEDVMNDNGTITVIGKDGKDNILIFT